MTARRDQNLMRSQRALDRLSSRPSIASRYAGQLREFQELLDAQRTPKPAADELSDLQLDRAELFVDGLRSAVRARKEQMEFQVRTWELYERELDELSEAIEKKRAGGRPSRKAEASSRSRSR